MPRTHALTDSPSYLQGRADGLDEAILRAMDGLTIEQIRTSGLIAALTERRRIALEELFAITGKQVA